VPPGHLSADRSHDYVKVECAWKVQNPQRRKRYQDFCDKLRAAKGEPPQVRVRVRVCVCVCVVCVCPTVTLGEPA
jgi:hypothetical protein